MVTTITSCTGCGACFNKCVLCAIKMELDADGFYKPIVNKELCTECGLCVKICPEVNPVFDNNTKPKCYAVMASDEIRMRSSSGGVFELLACQVFENNGYVCGAAWAKGFTGVEHIVVDNYNDLVKLQGSKYIQSNTNNVYNDVEKLLREGKFVLFTGCPCQVAGLKACLGELYYSDKLITIDLVCHGTPSVKVFRKYLTEEHSSKKITNIGFRDKEYGWNCSTINITYTDGEKYIGKSTKDSYYKAFLKNLSLNQPCGDCRFAVLPRQGDITLGDFWGINDYNRKLNDQKGTSVVLVNSNKGKKIFEKINKKMKLLKKVPIKAAAKVGLIERSSKHNLMRNKFFSRLDKVKLNILVNKLLTRKKKLTAIKTPGSQQYDIGLVGTFNAGNFGGLLSYYALYTLLTSWGYKVLLITRPNSMRDGYKDFVISELYPDYSISNNYENMLEMRELNSICRMFILGSDQMLQMDVIKGTGYYPFLSFVYEKKPKITFASSFGHNYLLGSHEENIKAAFYFKRFDYFSVREHSGINLVKENYGIDAVVTLDPVLMSEKKLWINLTKNFPEITHSPYIFAYIVRPTQDKGDMLKYVANNLSLEYFAFSEVYIDKDNQSMYWDVMTHTAKFDERLKYLMSANFIITDSYHGLCFALLFEKPFIIVMDRNTEKRGHDRFIHLLQLLNLQERLIYSIDELKNKIHLLESPDYLRIKTILMKERDFSANWAKDAIKSCLAKNTSLTDFDEIINIVHDELKSIKIVDTIRDKKLNALLNNAGLINRNSILKYMDVLASESNIFLYLDMLASHKKKMVIFIAVKDTPGYYFDKNISDKMHKIGFRESLIDRHQHTYVAVMKKGRIVYEKINNKGTKTDFHTKIVGNDIKIISMDYENGNMGSIKINGSEYSVNQRGINFVIFDLVHQLVIDSVCFDTHARHYDCHRC